MKTAKDTNSTPATDAQFGELKTMFERTARKTVPGKDGVQNLLERWNQAGPAIAAVLARYTIDLSLVDSDLLQPVTVLSTEGSETFLATEKFMVGTQDGVRIGFLSESFRTTFLSDRGKVELNVPDQELRVHRLRAISYDKSIVDELGNPELIETNLATMFELMKRQGAGQPGELHVDGWVNVFYVRDDSGALHTAYCLWDSRNKYWGLGARSLTDTGPCPWAAGCLIFSR